MIFEIIIFTKTRAGDDAASTDGRVPLLSSPVSTIHAKQLNKEYRLVLLLSLLVFTQVILHDYGKGAVKSLIG